MQPAISSPSSLPSPPLPKTLDSSFFPRSGTLTLARSHRHLRRPLRLAVRATVAIEKETPENERPETFLRDSDGPHSLSSSSSSERARFERMIRTTQDEVCEAIEAADGVGKFKEDVWSRAGGGGGISRVLQDGGVWEKAGVNVSVVYGMMPPEAYRAAKGEGVSKDGKKVGPVPFFAAGISSVLHPKNPFAPTLHFNYRYFETDAPKDAPGAPRQWWFGGGTDLTPAYIFEEDVKHFHKVQKQACDKFDPSFYPRFKKWCDDYFFIKHRGERRGLGGIFFDDLNDYDQEMLLAFASECSKSVVPAYLPIIERRKDTPFTDEHKAWQQLRRGRYVEFNLVFFKGKQTRLGILFIICFASSADRTATRGRERRMETSRRMHQPKGMDLMLLLLLLLRLYCLREVFGCRLFCILVGCPCCVVCCRSVNYMQE